MQQMGYTIEYMEVNTDLEKLHRMQHRKKMGTNYQGIKRQAKGGKCNTCPIKIAGKNRDSREQ